MNRQEALAVIDRVAEKLDSKLLSGLADELMEAVKTLAVVGAIPSPPPIMADTEAKTDQTDNHNRQGCRYCDWIDITQAHEDEDGPLNYCRACGRKLAQSDHFG